LNFDFDGTYVDLFYFKVRYQQDTFQESLDYNITSIKNLDLSIGANYYHDRINTPDPNQGLRVYSLGAFVQNSSQDQKTDSWAAYIDGTYHLTDRLSINAGARYSHDKRSMSYETLSPTGVPFLPFTSDKDSWSAFTPRASIRYELAPRTNVYVSYSQGYRAGAYNPSGPDATGRLIPANPEKIRSYEVGFKTNGRLIRFSSALFYYDYTDLQVVVIVPDPVLGTVSLLKNAPKAKIYGWDNELVVRPTERLTIHAGLELLHARFGHFPNATGIGVDPTNSFDIGGQTQDWTGLRMARAPDYSGNIGFDYTQPISYGSLFFTTNLTYTSGYPVSNPSVYGPTAPAALQRKQRFLQDGFVLLSAQLSWTDPRERYTVTVFGNNLTDETYRLSYEGGALGDTGVLADPRTWGVRVGYKF
jgi:iron complex outermembrane receptor protein